MATMSQFAVDIDAPQKVIGSVSYAAIPAAYTLTYTITGYTMRDNTTGLPQVQLQAVLEEAVRSLKLIDQID